MLTYKSMKKINVLLLQKKVRQLILKTLGHSIKIKKKEDGSSVPADNNNEIFKDNNMENNSLKNNNFSETLLHRNTIKKKLLFSHKNLKMPI